MNYQDRKRMRTKSYWFNHGKKLVTCAVCTGSGYNDIDGSTRCQGCSGRGRIRQS